MGVPWVSPWFSREGIRTQAVVRKGRVGCITTHYHPSSPHITSPPQTTWLVLLLEKPRSETFHLPEVPFRPLKGMSSR